jgi:hypothetical protein
MLEISEDLKQIVKSAVASIGAGLENSPCGVAGTIDFEIAVISSKEGNGRFKFLMLDTSAKYEKEKISKISFKIMGKTRTPIDNFVWKISPST